MDFDVQIKLAIYRWFARTGRRPSPGDVAGQVGLDEASVLEAYHRLRAQRVLVLESDDGAIRMAPPFSGVPTQHTVVADGVHYFANCAWDSFGIPAALHKPAIVRSRCEQSMESLVLEVGLDGPGQPRGSEARTGNAPMLAPESSAGDGASLGEGWVFHCLVPAAKWWDDIVFT